MRKACIISNTLEPLETRLQLNVGKIEFATVRMCQQRTLKSQRNFTTISSVKTDDDYVLETDVLTSRGLKVKRKSGESKKASNQGQEAYQWICRGENCELLRSVSTWRK